MRDRCDKRLGMGLTERHLKVIAMKVGLFGYRPHTFQEIAEEMGFCRARGDKIFRRVLARIIRHCERKGVDPYEMHILEESNRHHPA